MDLEFDDILVGRIVEVDAGVDDLLTVIGVEVTEAVATSPAFRSTVTVPWPSVMVAAAFAGR